MFSGATGSADAGSRSGSLSGTYGLAFSISALGVGIAPRFGDPFMRGFGSLPFLSGSGVSAIFEIASYDVGEEHKTRTRIATRPSPDPSFGASISLTRGNVAKPSNSAGSARLSP